MNGLTERLAKFVVEHDASLITAVARENSTKILLDTLGNILSGPGTDTASALKKFLRLSPTPYSKEACALAYATLGAATDFDDVLSVMPAHPSAIVWGALAACAQTHKISGVQAIEAHILGLEVGAWIGRRIGLDHYNQGFHSTSSLGIFCGIAALGRALRLDVQTVRTAFGIGASMASGLNRNFGTMTKPLHSGLAARNAVAAIDLACCGFTAAQDAFETRAGFFAAFGTQASDNTNTPIAFGKPWVVVEPGVSLRKFACYNANQRPMQGVLNLLAKLKGDTSQIKHLECRMPPGAMQGAIYPKPETGLQAKFSLQYVLAAGLVDGRYSLWTFSDEAVRRPAIQEALKRVVAAEHAHCSGGDPDFESKTPGTRGFVEVEMQYWDGRQETSTIAVSPGHPSIGLSWEDLEEKFMDCAAFGGLSEARSRTLFLLARKLSSLSDVCELFTDSNLWMSAA